VSLITRTVSAVRGLILVVAVAIAFLFGLATTVYLSLRSPEVKVPDIVGKDRFDAEKILGAARLNFRVRATRPSNQTKADTVLFQLPHAGEIVKAGQTVAMDVSRTAKEGEAAETAANAKAPGEAKEPENKNAAGPTANANENKPKRVRNPNKNANENSNVNSNARAVNGNGNVNRASTNENTSVNRNTNAGANTGSNRNAGDANANSTRSRTQNDNKRPPIIKPSPPDRE
jgi:PASTA domain